MALAKQMRIELVHIVELLPADVALPGIALTVAALVQEVERLVGELDATEMTGENQFPIQLKVALLSGRRDRPIANGRRALAAIVCATRWRCGRAGCAAAH